jgi:hypothetical protein
MLDHRTIDDLSILVSKRLKPRLLRDARLRQRMPLARHADGG